MYSVYKLNKQGYNIHPCCTPFPVLNQSVVPCLVLTVASWPAYRFLRRQVRWSGMPISLRIFHTHTHTHTHTYIYINKQTKKRIFHSLLWSTQSKALAQSMKQMFFWNPLAFSTIQQTLAIWSLVPLPFLNPVCTSGSSWFTYYWSLAWRILSIILLGCDMRTIVW